MKIVCPNHDWRSRLGRDSWETKSAEARLDSRGCSFDLTVKISSLSVVRKFEWGGEKYLQTVVCTQIQPISASAATLPYLSPFSWVTHLGAVSRPVSVNVYVCSCETVYWINFKRDSNAVKKRQDDLKGCLSYVLLQKLDSRDITLRFLPVTPPYYVFLYRFRKTV